jgi:hypothetical protein
MSMLSKRFRSSRWWSPVTTKSACAATAVNRNISSEGSLPTMTCGGSKGKTISDISRNLRSTSSGPLPIILRRLSILGYESTRFSSTIIAGDVKHFTQFSSMRSITALGGPPHNIPEITRLVSGTIRIPVYRGDFTSRRTSWTIAAISSRVGGLGSGMARAASRIDIRNGCKSIVSPLLLTMYCAEGFFKRGILNLRLFGAVSTVIPAILSLASSFIDLGNHAARLIRADFRPVVAFFALISSPLKIFLMNMVSPCVLNKNWSPFFTKSLNSSGKVRTRLGGIRTIYIVRSPCLLQKYTNKPFLGSTLSPEAFNHLSTVNGQRETIKQIKGFI